MSYSSTIRQWWVDSGVHLLAKHPPLHGTKDPTNLEAKSSLQGFISQRGKWLLRSFPIVSHSGLHDNVLAQWVGKEFLMVSSAGCVVPPLEYQGSSITDDYRHEESRSLNTFSNKWGRPFFWGGGAAFAKCSHFLNDDLGRYEWLVECHLSSAWLRRPSLTPRCLAGEKGEGRSLKLEPHGEIQFPIVSVSSCMIINVIP